MKPEFIKTTFQQKKNEEVREQWWLAYLTERNFLTVNNLSNNVGGYNIYLITDYMKKLDEMTTRDIAFIAITESNEKARSSREFHRGSKWDKNPILYRSNPIPEIKYQYQHFQSYFSSNAFSITNGLRNQLNLWFKSQLDNQCNDELLRYLVEQERKDFFDRLQKQLMDHIQETEKILEFIKVCRKS